MNKADHSMGGRVDVAKRWPRPLARLALGALGMWALFVLARYFVKVPSLLNATGLDWQRDMNSLSFLTSLTSVGIEDLAFWNYPWLTEAMTRAAISIGGAALVLGGADGLGRLAFRLTHFEIAPPGVRLCARMSIGFVLISLVMALAGAIGAISTPLALAVTAPLATYSAISSYREFRSAWGGRVPGGIWRFLSLLGIALALFVALAPEVEYDAVWYHLGFARMFLETGSIHSSPTEFVSLYPMTWELLYSTAMAVGGSGAAKLLHFATLGLSAMMVFALARELTPRVPPWLPVALFVAVPTVLWEATTAYVDLALTFHVCLVAYALLRYVRGRAMPWVVLAAVNLGAALATKHLALVFAGLSMVGLIGAIWRLDGSLRPSIRPALVLGSGLVLAVPWYWRAISATGNPVFPELYDLFGAPAVWWDSVTEAGLDSFKERFGRARTLSNLVTLPWDVTIHGSRYGGSLGVVFLVLIPASFLRRWTPAAKWFGVLTLAYLCFWVSPFSSLQLRFLLPAIPFLCLFAGLGAVAVGELLKDAQWSRWAKPAAAVLAIVLLIHFPPFLSLHETDRVEWDGWLTHVVHQVPGGVVLGAQSEQAYLEQKLPAYRGWQYADDHLPQSAYVLNFSDENHLYTRTRWMAAHATLARPALNGTDSSTPVEVFDKLGLTHVMIPTARLSSPEGDDPPLLSAKTLKDEFEVEYQDTAVAILRRRHG